MRNCASEGGGKPYTENDNRELCVKTLDGREVDLYALYPNRYCLLLIYNNRCLGCTGRALPLAHELQLEFPHIQVTGIHSNFNAELVTEADITGVFVSKSLPYPIFIDDDASVFHRFHSEGTPQWIIIAPDKTVYRSIFGSQDNAKNRLYYALESLV
jgi:hypothetical protein